MSTRAPNSCRVASKLQHAVPNIMLRYVRVSFSPICDRIDGQMGPRAGSQPTSRPAWHCRTLELRKRMYIAPNESRKRDSRVVRLLLWATHMHFRKIRILVGWWVGGCDEVQLT